MLRSTYVIEAENGVGLYLSKYLAENGLRYLSDCSKSIIKFATYGEAKNYIFSRYFNDGEIDISAFRVNYTLFRDVSARENFYVQSLYCIGFGVNMGMKLNFQRLLNISEDDIVEVDSTREAEYYARNAFVNVYGRRDFYYSGPLLPGESLSLAEMARYNQLDVTCADMPIKIRGISLLPPAVKCEI